MSLGHLTEPLRKPACKIFHLSTLTFFISATEIGNSYTPLGAHTLIRTLQGSGNLDSERRSFDCLFGLEERRWPSWWRRARAAAAGAARTFPSRGAPPPGRAAGVNTFEKVAGVEESENSARRRDIFGGGFLPLFTRTRERCRSTLMQYSYSRTEQQRNRATATIF